MTIDKDQIIKKWYKVEDIFKDIEGDPDNVLMNIPPEINEHLGLKEGDTLDVTTEGNNIIISKKYDKKMKNLKIEIDDDTVDNMHTMYNLEQQIMECWQLVDDVNLLYEQVMDNDLHKDQDKLANALLGLCTIYGMKFEKAFDTYAEALKQRQSNFEKFKN